MNILRHIFWRAVAAASLMALSVGAESVPLADNLQHLLAQEDTDGDQAITIRDHTTPFVIRTTTGRPERTLTNFYGMSVLLQELEQAEDENHATLLMERLQTDQNVVDRTQQLIHEYYWSALTRRIDAQHVDVVVHDSKVRSKYDYIYVSTNDPVAIKYFQNIENSKIGQRRSPALKVVQLPSPEKITGAFVRNLDGAHGLLSLKLELNAHGEPVCGVPYVVPGGRFNELYCWDSYFTILGLLQDGRTDLARGMADNLLYEVQFYGKVPNANRTYYLTRSQPPFLTSIARAVFESHKTDKAWLEHALGIILTEYQNVWLGKARLVKIGQYELSRYYDEGDGPCPEVEPGHYDERLQPWISQIKPADPDVPISPYRFLNEYLFCGRYAGLLADGMSLQEFFKHDRAVRESGHDTTHRFDDRTADFVSVDLNALLYKYERDFAELIESQFGGDLPSLGEPFRNPQFWRTRAGARKTAMHALMWDEQRGYFFDYDFKQQKRSNYISATGLWPLWAKMLDAHDPQDLNRARRCANFAREKLEQFSGLTATAKESVSSARWHDARQWDYPFGWAPHQMLAWVALKNYGLDADAQRLAYRWLYTIAKNAHDYSGMIPEKFDAVTGSHEVFVEYGNVGTKFTHIATEGFGWMNASFEVGLHFLSPTQMNDLRALKPLQS